MRACGLDVHKDSVFVCILADTGEIFEEKFGVLTPELEQLRDYLSFHQVTDVCMERARRVTSKMPNGLLPVF
jgi:transposase